MGATLSRRHVGLTLTPAPPTDPGWLLLLHGQPLWNDAALALTPSVHSDHQQARLWALGTSENLQKPACSVSLTVPDVEPDRLVPGATAEESAVPFLASDTEGCWEGLRKVTRCLRSGGWR